METDRNWMSQTAKEHGLGDAVGAIDDAKRSQLKALLLLGKTRGYLTHAEIIEFRKDKSFETEAMELITATLSDMGIEVYPREPDENKRILSNTDFSPEAEKGSVGASISWDEAIEFDILLSPSEADEKLLIDIPPSAYHVDFLNEETSRNRLVEASEGGVQHFCFLLADLTFASSSRFFWFQFVQELHNSLCNDLWVRIFEGDDQSVIIGFNESMMNSFRRSTSNLSSGEIVKKIDDIWVDHGASSSLRVSYVGTYESLCNGNNSFERLLRQKFRSDHNLSIKGGITEEEVVTFNEYVSSDIY